jgi:hypothetical protein
MVEYQLLVDTEMDREKSHLALGGAADISAEKIPPATMAKLTEASESRREIEVGLQDPVTFEEFGARAIVSSDPEALPEADKVWLIDASGKGRLSPTPWAIKIVERIAEREKEFRALPRRKPSLAERRGRILVDLLKEREEKERKKGGR